MKNIRSYTAVLTAIVMSFTAFAQEQPVPAKTPRVAKRQIQQQARIQEGVKSGELTKRETRKLEREQVKIQHDKKEAKADGTITPEERLKLAREQRKANRDIYRLKHNDQEKK